MLETVVSEVDAELPEQIHETVASEIDAELPEEVLETIASEKDAELPEETLEIATPEAEENIPEQIPEIAIPETEPVHDLLEHADELHDELIDHEEHEHEVNYDDSSREELIGLLQKAVVEADISSVKTKIAQIKVAFMKKRRKKTS